MQVKILTPEKTLLDTQATQVVVQAVQGKMGILDQHCPLTAALLPGEVRVQSEGQWQSIPSSAGLVSVENNRVLVLLDG